MACTAVLPVYSDCYYQCSITADCYPQSLLEGYKTLPSFCHTDQSELGNHHMAGQQRLHAAPVRSAKPTAKRKSLLYNEIMG